MYSAQLCRRTGGAFRGTEKAVSDVKVQQQQALSRQEAARFIAALAEGLGDDGKVTVRLGSSTLELSVGSHVDCELEVTVDGDELELELELKWSTSGRPSVRAAQGPPQTEDREEDESDERESQDQSEEDQAEEGDVEQDRSEELPSAEDAAPEEVVQGVASDTEAAGSSAAESVPAVAPDPSPQPRRARRKAVAATGKAASNGVDTAAVRAWAAANGMTVSPRGRIKDEVIEAFRAAGN
jgi:amphi-Trp domain-containing protein